MYVKKIHQFLTSIKKDARKRNLVPFSASRCRNVCTIKVKSKHLFIHTASDKHTIQYDLIRWVEYKYSLFDRLLQYTALAIACNPILGGYWPAPCPYVSPCLCLSVSVASRNSMETDGRIQLVLAWMEAASQLAHTAFQGNSGISENWDTSLWNFGPNSGHQATPSGHFTSSVFVVTQYMLMCGWELQKRRSLGSAPPESREVTREVTCKYFFSLLLWAYYNCDSRTIRVRFEHDTTSYEELCAFEQ